ncbi:MAG TPA: PPK2 family polyphosphate kinase [Actinocrinis sp.]|nr:PPK2 family polyphosphate kinase [Actinocrinis sp.]
MSEPASEAAPEAEAVPAAAADAATPAEAETPVAASSKTKKPSKSETKPAAKSKAKPTAKPKAKSEAKAKPEPEQKTKPKSETKAEAKPKSEAKAEPQSETKSAAKSKSKAEAKLGAKPEAKSDPKAAPQPESKPSAKSDPKAEATPDPKPEAKSKLKPKRSSSRPTPFSDMLRCPPGRVDLSKIATDSIEGAVGTSENVKERTLAELAAVNTRLSDLQERLFASSRGADDNRRVLLILQGMDTAGKGGVVGHVVGTFSPYGVQLTAFKAPTAEERSHDFLWRIRKAVPDAGYVGVFDRSHYEDVLIARVRSLVPQKEWSARYGLINDFERELADDGCTVVKCFLHVSPEVQRKRLLARLEDETKLWKYNPADVDERAMWPQYQKAYEAALEKCSTESAPWFIVPADRKWYRNFAVANLILEAFEGLDPKWPRGDFNLSKEKARVKAA